MFGNFEVSDAQVQVADEMSAVLATMHSGLTGGAHGAHVLTPASRMTAETGIEPESTYAAFVFDGDTGEPRGLAMVIVGARSSCGHDDCPRVAEAFTSANQADAT